MVVVKGGCREEEAEDMAFCRAGKSMIGLHQIS